ncbi:MAG: SET domain-containing protein-lysine N-methyltransferase [Actinobacteria bacterium]|nr:SET domain-containing protein-lysine N-methyltransferase [Actinomycetota bacterium]
MPPAECSAPGALGGGQSYGRHAGVTSDWSRIAGRGLFARTPLPAGTPALCFRVVPAQPSDVPRLNHSCEPNLRWVDRQHLVTIRDVAAGEELTCDYATFVHDPDHVLFCHCETYRCRQVVEGTDWRIPQLQRRYAGHWHPDVQELIDEASR